MPVPSHTSIDLKLRDIDTTLPMKPMRDAYGTKVAEYFKPAMREYFTEDIQDQRINALITLAKELGSPTFTGTKEGQVRKASYSPWDKEVRINPESRTPIIMDRDKYGKTESGRDRLLTGAEDLALEELAHAYQDTHKTDAWEREIYEDRNQRPTIFTKKGRDIMKGQLGQSLLNAVRGLPSSDFTAHLGEKFYNMAGYGRPDSMEHEAHGVISPELRERYFAELGEAAGDYYR